MVLRAASILLLAFFLLQAQKTPPSKDSQQPNPAAAEPQSLPMASCPAGGPLGGVDLSVQSPRGDQPLPFRTINHLSEGDTILYSPILRGKEKRPGEIALVLVPTTRAPGEDLILVTDPKPANKSQQWKMKETISVAAFVYGPAGLNKKKVKSFLSRDTVLTAQLADYADKTAQAEALVAALSNSESSAASVNAALNGFASQYGFALQLDKNAPISTQAETLFTAMNPQLATYNPLASSTAARAGQTASLATGAAALFLGSPVGLAAGGTAMLLDLRAIAFPDTQFRSAFAQPLENSGLNLCGQQGQTPAHTRVAYIWATRIPNAPTPTIQIGDANFIPATQKSPLPVNVPEPQWKFLQRARAWTLKNEKNENTPVSVLKLGNQKALEINLTRTKLAPGDYQLTGYWDWVSFAATGTVHVRSLSDFSQARLLPASQDQLLAKAGKIPVTLAGDDFQFTTGVQFKKMNDEFAIPESVRFLLPTGLRRGPQDRMDVQIDTSTLDPGQYQFLISQQDGKSHPVDFKVLPNPPKISNFPILANQGVATQHYTLKGERLTLLARLESPGAVLDLSPSQAGDGERNITVQLKSDPRPGTVLPVKAYLQDRSEPLTFPDALQITGPLPVIASSKLSLPTGMAISVGQSEFPAGDTLTAVLDVKNIDHQSVVQLGCAENIGQTATLHIGEQTSKWNLQQLSQDQLFLSFDTSELPAGCTLQAVIDNGRGGESQPAVLAHIIRVPRVEFFTLADNPAQASPAGTRTYTFTGTNLEMIEKAGWDQGSGVDVTELPAPIPGVGRKQSLAIALPDPPKPLAPLYIWLRGDGQGRTTALQAPPLPAAVVTPAK